MPRQLRSTDVVIVGMGAAGGVAALPLAEAGLDVVSMQKSIQEQVDLEKKPVDEMYILHSIILQPNKI